MFCPAVEADSCARCLGCSLVPLVAVQWGTILTVLIMILFLLVVVLPWRANQGGLLSAELLAAASAAA